MAESIPAPIYVAATGLMIALTAALQEWIRAKREKAAAEKAAAEAKAAADKVAVQVKEVKEALETKSDATDKKLDAMADTGEKTHTLVNSNMGVQLSLNKAVT